MKTTKRFLSALLAAALLCGMAACGESSSDVSGDTTADGGTTAETTEAVTEFTYDYPDVDYEGYEFKIINLESFWDCYMRLDLDEQTGETVDDAVYNRNRKIEEKFNFKFKEVIEPYPGWGSNNATIQKLQQSILADDDEYDAAYGLIPYAPAIITDGYLVDLYTIPELQLDEEWWDGTLNESLEIDGKLYAATSPLQLTSLDLSWVLLFNKNILDLNNVEYPYDLVREGKWTLDKQKEYMAALTSLNGDDSFTYNAEGNCVYGIVCHNTMAASTAMLSAGSKYFERSSSGDLSYIQPTERNYDVLSKLKEVYNSTTGYAFWHLGSSDKISEPGTYYNVFFHERAAFLTTELKGAKLFRDMKSDYGIVPFAKFDENQEDYITYVAENAGVLLIPKTNDDLSRTGVILDALSYESKQSVLPLYYNQTLSQKALRDDDSIEMLNIINESRMFETGMIFGITNKLHRALHDMVVNQDDTAASLYASYESTIKTQLQSLLDSVQ